MRWRWMLPELNGTRPFKSSFRAFFYALLLLVVASWLLLVIVHAWGSWGSWAWRWHIPSPPTPLAPHDLLEPKHHQLQASSADEQIPARVGDCTHWDCLNVYRCGGRGRDRLSVYVYPPQRYTNEKGDEAAPPLSLQYYTLLKTIIQSEYYTPDPTEACLFVPGIDTLNQETINLKLTEQALQSLSHWENGENHIIFNMVPGTNPDYNTVIDLHTGRALIAGAGFNSWTYRTSFDVSLPFFSLDAVSYNDNYPVEKSYFVISSQMNLYDDHVQDLQEMSEIHGELLLLLGTCDDESQSYNNSMRCQYKTSALFNYPEVLRHGQFCIVGRGIRLAQPALLEVMAAGCIPVVIADSIIMPFKSVIDWHRAAVFIPEDNLLSLINVLNEISKERRTEMANQAKWLYDNYFSSMKQITMVTLDIINDRVFPLMAKSYEQWNMPPNSNAASNPLFLPITAPKAPGFTAVILTFDRVESLFTLINKLVKTPSLQKILVIWNNQKKPPPPPSHWPVISKPLKVRQTKENKLSNRFYPYDEIETECMLTIDDDIIMLTPDELEFGYEVWREFPDRIVGFPSRVHLWDNITQAWKYHSEWTNQISMVLTGAAFHHKFWAWYYTVRMPSDIREWVDENMNCEDIAMNFLVANLTNKPPIKVAPRKKFKCPECTNTEMLSADIGHMTERSACVDRLSHIYGRMPLKTVEFRADPVLFRDTFPQKLKWFNDIGSL
ncbi:exostosin glycosyltransferase sotv [Arctopsyche grandis]|uniref:exostosin glycosyltransferase sotv n=1 Tax=Arctopsyche grandis TaxID=121162 RepID=UPI00406D750C